MNRRLTAGVLAALLLVSGCAAPRQQYISADSYGMYFSMPKSWTAVPSRDLVSAQKGWTDDVGNVFQQTVLWQGAWSSSSELGADAVFAAKGSNAPVVYAFVRDLITVEQQSATGTDVNIALRDLVLPTTAIQDAGGEVRTERVSDGSFLGIHQLATYASGGSLNTTEVVAMLAPRKNRVYALLVRCSAHCFDANTGTINDLFDSLTFKEPRGQ